MVLARPGEVLVQDHVEHPVQAVLDLPVRAHDRKEPGGGERPREQVVAGRGGRLVALLARGGDLADRGEAREGVGFGEPGDVVEERATAGLDPAVVAVGGDGAVVRRRLGVVEQQADVVVQRGWLALSAST